ncbi:histone-lysine N-methyltransferase ATX5-like [Arachis ipaensis]|uniref:histone-lysine N-methyltransferase ATX5-like n=1 Tax=Arachis ipaensis TaxID=130454 RepID=UPI000A2B5FD6|nr:histone-lysine N-methyltransferase ATX5-like [Arachis ipaensis]
MAQHPSHCVSLSEVVVLPSPSPSLVAPLFPSLNPPPRHPSVPTVSHVQHLQCRGIDGGALKPTDIDTLWVHVTCAWFRLEVTFASDEKMEPALGILSIPSSSFVKIRVICKQIHGSCTQYCKSSTYFHAMCASRAGYRMELHISEKNDKQTTKMVSYCAYHRYRIFNYNKRDNTFFFVPLYGFLFRVCFCHNFYSFLNSSSMNLRFI